MTETVKDSAGTAAQAAGEAGKFAVKNAVVPLMSAAAGAAAAVVVGKRTGKKGKKVLGVRLPNFERDGLESLAKSIGEAGKQFGKLADEVKTGREKAEQVGKALS